MSRRGVSLRERTFGRCLTGQGGGWGLITLVTIGWCFVGELEVSFRPGAFSVLVGPGCWYRYREGGSSRPWWFGFFLGEVRCALVRWAGESAFSLFPFLFSPVWEIRWGGYHASALVCLFFTLFSSSSGLTLAHSFMERE